MITWLRNFHIVAEERPPEASPAADLVGTLSCRKSTVNLRRDSILRVKSSGVRQFGYLAHDFLGL